MSSGIDHNGPFDHEGTTSFRVQETCLRKREGLEIKITTSEPERRGRVVSKRRAGHCSRRGRPVATSERARAAALSAYARAKEWMASSLPPQRLPFFLRCRSRPQLNECSSKSQCHASCCSASLPSRYLPRHHQDSAHALAIRQPTIGRRG